MTPSSLHYFPVTLPYLLLLGLLYVFAIGTMLRFASLGMGISRGSIIAIMALSLLCSSINIPVAMLPGQQIYTTGVVDFFGMPYVVPLTREWPGTVIAVNVGGAVIPILLSLYLMVRNNLYALSITGIVLVAAVCHMLAKPVPGVGIALPVFVPPIATAIVALVLSRRQAGPLAYISGSLGTLAGADLLNLDKLSGIGAPIASIGGAGTFDGIFITGLLAVVVAAIFGPRHVRP